tara:strand:- start:5670 stop:15293 length:9624 start_codon:yes stop_codon:yes gene_type:complete
MPQIIKNPKILYLEDLYSRGIITSEDYINRLDLQYRMDPTSYSEEDVDYMEKRFKSVDKPFERNLEVGDSNLVSVMNQFVSGVVEGFTTLGWAEDGDTSGENIANKLGHLLGFAPDVIASAFSMGAYVPVAAAKRASIRGAAGITKALRKGGEIAPGFLRKQVGPKAFTLQSVPMKVADKATGFLKAQIGETQLLTSGFLSKGLAANKTFQNIGEQGLHLGIALGVSTWRDGPQAMVESSMHGFAAGAMFGTIGNYVNVSNMLINPKLAPTAKKVIRGVAKNISENQTRARLQGLDMVVKGAAGGAFTGGLATMQGQPLPEQIYEYLLGGFFGATAQRRGTIDRDRWLSKHTLPQTKNLETARENIKKMPDFRSLKKADQDYIMRFTDTLQNEQRINFRNVLDIEAINEIKELAIAQGIDPNKLDGKQFQKIQKERAKKKAVIAADQSEEFVGPIPKGKRPKNAKINEPEKVHEEIIFSSVDFELSEFQNRVKNNRIENEGMEVPSNTNLNIIAKTIQKGFETKYKDLDDIKINLYHLSKNVENDFLAFADKVTLKYPELTDTIVVKRNGKRVKITKFESIRKNLGKFLKMKKNLQPLFRLEIDLRNPKKPTLRVKPTTDLFGKDLDVVGSENKANKIYDQFDLHSILNRDQYAEIRIIADDAFMVDRKSQYGFGKNKVDRFTFKREGMFGYKPGEEGKFVDHITDRAILNISKKLQEDVGSYVYSGAKDTGNLIIHKIPYTTKDANQPHYIKASEINKFFSTIQSTFKEEIQILGAKEFNKRKTEIVSNWIYQLIESGHLNVNAQRTADSLTIAMNQYINDPQYTSIKSLNKYLHMAQGSNIKQENEILEGISDVENNQLKIMAIEDIDSNFKIEGTPSQSGADAGLLLRQDVFDNTINKNFLDETAGFMKLSGFTMPTIEYGNIIMKTGTFRASDAQNEALIKKKIHGVGRKTALKSNRGVSFGKLAHTDKGESFITDGSILKIKPEELYLDYGVYESGNKLGQAPHILKQMFDKYIYQQLATDIGVKDADGFKEAYNDLIEKSVKGMDIVNSEFGEALKKQDDTIDFELEHLGMREINDGLKDIDTPIAKLLLKKILERGETVEVTSEDASMESVLSNLSYENFKLPEMLSAVDYSTGAILDPYNIEYIRKSVANYAIKRVTRPKAEYGFQAKLSLRDEEIRHKFKDILTDETFLLHDNYKELTIKVRQVQEGAEIIDKEIRLEDAFIEYERLLKLKGRAGSENLIKYEQALEFLMVRSPNSSLGGTRVLRFAGFAGRRGYGVITTSKNDHYLGGADKDADAVFVYQNMAEAIKKGFKNYESEFTDPITGITKDFTTIGDTFRGVVKQYEENKKFLNKDTNINSFELIKMMIPSERIKLTRQMSRAKAKMGVFVNSGITHSTIMDVLISEGGEVMTHSTGKNTKLTFSKLAGEGITTFLPSQGRYFGRNLKTGELTGDPKDAIYRVSLKPMEDAAKKMQSDLAEGVNILADASVFSRIDYPENMAKAILSKYFLIEAKIIGRQKQNGKWVETTRFEELDYKKKAYHKIINEIKIFDVVNEMRKKGYSTQRDVMSSTNEIKAAADDYLDIIGDKGPYFNKVAQVFSEMDNLNINPVRHYAGNTSRQNEMVAALAMRLRDNMMKDPLFKQFDIYDSYYNRMEAEIDLMELSRDPSGPDKIYAKAWEYVTITQSLNLTKRFEMALEKIGVEHPAGYSKEIFDFAYRIKSYYDTQRGLMREEASMLGAERTELLEEFQISNADINQLITEFKNDRGQRMNQIGIPLRDYEYLIDAWLQSIPTSSPRTDYMARQKESYNDAGKKLDNAIKKEMKLLEINPQAEIGGHRNSRINRLLNQKAASFQKLRPNLTGISRSRALKTENVKSFYESTDAIIKKAIEEIGINVNTLNKKESILKFLQDGGVDNIQAVYSLTDITKQGLMATDLKLITKEGEKIDFNKDIYDPIEHEILYEPPIEKTKDGEKVIQDTKTVPRKFRDTIETVDELMPQFAFLESMELNKTGYRSEEQDIEIKKLIDIIHRNPGSLENLEYDFQGMSETRNFGLATDIRTMSLKELKSFNNALAIKYSKSDIVDKIGNVIRAPGKWEHLFNYEKIGRDMEKFDRQSYMQYAKPIKDKNGKITEQSRKIPTSSLELGRLTIDKMDQLQKASDDYLNKRIDGLFEFTIKDDPAINQYQDLLFEAAVNRIEYNDGKYSDKYQKQDEISRKEIKKSYTDTEATLALIEKDGVKFPMDSKKANQVGHGKSIPVSGGKFVDSIKGRVQTLLKDVNTNYIQSRHLNLSKVLTSTHTKGLNKWIISKERIQKKGSPGYQTQQMEKLFLDKNGLIREELIHKVIEYATFNAKASPREVMENLLPSVNDHRFMKFHINLKDRLQVRIRTVRGLEQVDLNKPLNSKASNWIKKQVTKELIFSKGKKGSKKTYYEKALVGEILEGYWPRLDHHRIKANIPKLEKWKKQQVEADIERFRKNPNEIPAALRVMKAYKREGFETDEKLFIYYREHKMGEFERLEQLKITPGQAMAEKQITDLLSKTNQDNLLGDYSANNVRSRGETFMPYYQKDLQALRNYTSGFFKMMLTNTAGLRSELILRDFDYQHKGQEYARNWSNYMRDAFINMMGMSSYRAFGLHGISKNDVSLLNSYIENGLKIDGLSLGKYQKDLLLDMQEAISVSANEQWSILETVGSIKVAEERINELRLLKAKRLLKDVNVTGKYGTIYHAFSDEVGVKYLEKINDRFGGGLIGDLPKNRKARHYALQKKIKQFSDLEGKFELYSLLTAPKTLLTNMYGGTINTISDVGWSTFRNAGNTDWMVSNLFGSNAKFKFYDPVTGRSKDQSITTKKDIDNWLESLGVYDSMFLDMVNLDQVYGKQNRKRFWQEAVRRINKAAKDPKVRESKESYNNMRDKTLKELARDMKMNVPVEKAGAFFMSYSERKLRGRAFLANYIAMKQNLDPVEVNFNSPALINYALKGVQASQFLYQATYRPNFANTSIGRVMTRFQPYAWNSIGRRLKLYKDANVDGWAMDVQSTKKAQRQFTFDLMSIALGTIFTASLFEYALSPPMNWLQDSAQLLFGDERAKERAFFNQYPSKVLAPLQIVTPPIGRFVITPVTSILNGEMENFAKFQLATYFPFGRLARDSYRTFQSPAMAVDFLTGLPLHQVAKMRRDHIDSFILENDDIVVEDMTEVTKLEKY